MRWTYWFSLLLLPFAVSSTDAQTNDGTSVLSITNNGPRIELAEAAFDFGRIEAGKTVRHDFAFTNTGNQVLEIQDIVASCGCTTVGEWNRNIEPGKSGIIPVTLNTADLSGKTLKNLNLACNDPSQPRLILYMKVDVYKLIDARPLVAAFSFGPDYQTNQTRAIWITNHMDELVALEKPVLTNDTIKTELMTITEGKVFQLLVTTVPPLPEGSSVVAITLKTSSPRMPEVAVSAYSSVQPSVSIAPPRIFLDSGPLKEQAVFTINVRNKSTNVLHLSDTVVTGRGADVKLAETEPGRAFALTLTLPAGFKIAPNENVEVRAKSNRASRPWIIVPVLQPESEEETDASGSAGSPAAPANAGQGQTPSGAGK